MRINPRKRFCVKSNLWHRMRKQRGIFVFSLRRINILSSGGRGILWILSESFCWLPGWWGYFFVIAWFIFSIQLLTISPSNIFHNTTLTLQTADNENKIYLLVKGCVLISSSFLFHIMFKQVVLLQSQALRN